MALCQTTTDGRGRALDSVFIERLWRSLKHEGVHLYAYESLAQARRGIAKWLDFYNTERFHEGLGTRLPRDVYLSTPLSREGRRQSLKAGKGLDRERRAKA